MDCPRCEKQLAVTFCTGGRMLMCAYCGGTAVTVEMLRRFAPQERVDDIWRQTKSTREKSTRSCPSCEAKMRRVMSEAGEQVVILETCALCHIVWFDESELKAFSPDATEPTEDEKDEAAKHLGVKDRAGASDEVWRFAGRLRGLFGG